VFGEIREKNVGSALHGISPFGKAECSHIIKDNFNIN
jgi:hypothetical protein